MAILILFLVVLFSSGAVCAETDALDTALSKMGISRTEFRVDPEVMLTRGGTAHKLPVFDQWFQHPLRIPSWERYWRTALLSSNGRLHPLFNTCAAALSLGTRRDLIPPTPVEKYRARAKQPDALIGAIRALDPKARVYGESRLPVQVRELAAMTLLAIDDALEWRRMALREVPTEKWRELFATLAEPLERSSRDSSARTDTLFPQAYDQFYHQQSLLAKIDLRLLFSAGDDLTSVVDTVAEEFASLSVTDSFDVRCITRFGIIRISAGMSTEYKSDEPLLLVMDLSGDDVYHTGGGTADADHPVSVVIDASGNDRYETQNPQPAFGAAILGFGILLDMDGNDTYSSHGFYSQGCGIAGIGLLRDEAGDDTYKAIGTSQGFGMFGVGILSDHSGNDTYQAYTESQGCGMTMGFGLLCDVLGDDHYTANDSDIIFPSPQSDKHNSSMCQGAGYGPRRDYLDAHSLAGGVGMLLDSAGNDVYSGGVFSQAVGYWYGIGILDDRSGNDQYNAVWYGQSATAHMGISYLDDGSGDDIYTATMSVTCGAAHDLSTSLFVDESGNDQYRQAANALGRSLNSSVALFADLQGDDHYQATESLGQSVNFSSTGWRAETWTTALFLDLSGTDSYLADRGKDNTLWRQETATPLPLLRGIGLDSDKLHLKWD